MRATVIEKKRFSTIRWQTLLSTTMVLLCAAHSWGAAAIVHPAAKPSVSSKLRLSYREPMAANINAKALGQEALASAVSEDMGVCVNRHNSSVLLIEMAATQQSWMVTAPPLCAANSVAAVAKSTNPLPMAKLLDNTLAATTVRGSIASSWSR